MAINYATLFQQIGKIVAKSNSLATLASTTLPADLQAIVATYGTAATAYSTAAAPIQGIDQTYQGFSEQAAGWRRALTPYVERTLTNRDAVTSQLDGLTSTDPRSVLLAIIDDMLAASISVKANTVTVGSVTPGASNTGNGTALVDIRLDGFNSPITGSPSTIRYDGMASQLCVPSETMQLTCTSDSFGGSGLEGAETWSWAGRPRQEPFTWQSEGSGAGPSIQTAHGESLVNNLGFDAFAGNTPSGWTISNGTAGTHVFRETSSANLYRGASAMKFLGTGAQATISVSQSVPASRLVSRRRYLFTIRMKRDGGSSGDTTIKFVGTGYDAGGTEQVAVETGSIPTSYALYHFYWTTPSIIPSNLALVISTTGTLADGVGVYFDSGSFKPVEYHGGVNVNVVSGSTPWVVGDKLQWTVNNTTTGLFQDFFRKAFSVQLPSSESGTLDDSWAE
ncbi:MAG TPA: hypothetical protein PKC18_14840 [Lacipirellulaceae bacterium]|nr:hypothetical protein [Lacipirellulaceae bacterium]